jgi:hypothetical protein
MENTSIIRTFMPARVKPKSVGLGREPTPVAAAGRLYESLGQGSKVTVDGSAAKR